MQTADTIKTMINNDPTVSEEERNAILAIIDPANVPKKKVTPITTKQACAFFDDVHPVTLRRWEKQGKIHAIRYTARRIRWSLEEIQDFSRNGMKAEAGI